MATDLTTTINETTILNGEQRGSTNINLTSNVIGVKELVIPVLNSTQILNLAEAGYGYCRITNLDDLTVARLSLKAGETCIQFKLQPKNSFILGDMTISIDCGVHYLNITEILVESYSELEIEIELFATIT